MKSLLKLRLFQNSRTRCRQTFISKLNQANMSSIRWIWIIYGHSKHSFFSFHFSLISRKIQSVNIQWNSEKMHFHPNKITYIRELVHFWNIIQCISFFFIVWLQRRKGVLRSHMTNFNAFMTYANVILVVRERQRQQNTTEKSIIYIESQVCVVSMSLSFIAPKTLALFQIIRTNIYYGHSPTKTTTCSSCFVPHNR